ncbi:unnamed protein product [Pleuronectes platessa]|uniref:Uncharacterized protein n=1 Tax=Pleuronectes platessa TaxID=8262 RepID=A0A9N7YR56_PLEPL|nr:unnamed protein product [Pleuronectes platessa]
MADCTMHALSLLQVTDLSTLTPASALITKGSGLPSSRFDISVCVFYVRRPAKNSILETCSLKTYSGMWQEWQPIDGTQQDAFLRAVGIAEPEQWDSLTTQ